MLCWWCLRGLCRGVVLYSTGLYQTGLYGVLCAVCCVLYERWGRKGINLEYFRTMVRSLGPASCRGGGEEEAELRSLDYAWILHVEHSTKHHINLFRPHRAIVSKGTGSHNAPSLRIFSGVWGRSCHHVNLKSNFQRRLGRKKELAHPVISYCMHGNRGNESWIKDLSLH